MKKMFCAVFASAALLAVSGCSQQKNVPVKEGSAVDYSLNFFRSAVAQQDDNANVFVSPYSAGTALSMLAEGATGQTLEELDKALNGIDFVKCAPVADTAVDVRSANSVWVKKGFDVKKSYLDKLSGKYNACVKNLDFDNPESVGIINGWCYDNTEGRIPEIIDGIDPQMVMFLINALYFKAPWQNAFNEKETSINAFHGSLGDKDVPFMFSDRKIGYGEYQGCQMARLPYAGGRYSMLLVLPSEGMSVNDVLAYVNEETYKTAISSLQQTPVKFRMPKFKFENTTILNGVLADMGVEKVFSKGAELGEISMSNICVDEVKQKCFIEVNEAGSEAAAVTSVGVRLTSVRPGAINKVMTLDRPFLFAIVDTQTDNMLFIGRIMNL